MEICNKDKCTGCGVCASVCAHSSIRMEEDSYGELHPVVNDLNCIQCGLCKKVCPNNTEPVFSYPQKCYAAWITDNIKRAKCASGGIATIMAEYVIKKGGVFFGTAYDFDFVPRVTYTDKIDDLEKFKGSKYAQSIMGENILRKAKEYLKSDRFVLFIGTPCQVAGLKNYLHKEYDNLIAIDLICHGVCPTRYFTDEVSYIMSKHKLTDISDIRFRGNDGHNFCLVFWQGKRQGNSYKDEIAYIKPRYEQPYFAGFMLGVTLRENCYTCNYARPERVGDITIGDFLRLGKTTPFPYRTKQVSVVLTNNSKGISFYEQVAKYCGEGLMNVERDYSERLKYRPSLLEPFKRHPQYGEFREKYLKQGYVRAIRSTLRYFLLKQRYMRIKRSIINCIKKSLK